MGSAWRWVGLCAALVACGESTPAPGPDAAEAEAPDGAVAAPCVFDDLVRDKLGGAADRDCGLVPLGAAEADYRDAHACVAEALTAGETFVVAWDLVSPDSQVRAAYLRGEAVDGTVSQIIHDSDPSGGSMLGAAAGETRCEPFTDHGACSEPEDGLCFSCGASGFERLCD